MLLGQSYLVPINLVSLFFIFLCCLTNNANLKILISFFMVLKHFSFSSKTYFIASDWADYFEFARTRLDWIYGRSIFSPEIIFWQTFQYFSGSPEIIFAIFLKVLTLFFLYKFFILILDHKVNALLVMVMAINTNAVWLGETYVVRQYIAFLISMYFFLKLISILQNKEKTSLPAASGLLFVSYPLHTGNFLFSFIMYFYSIFSVRAFRSKKATVSYLILLLSFVTLIIAGSIVTQILLLYVPTYFRHSLEGGFSFSTGLLLANSLFFYLGVCRPNSLDERTSADLKKRYQIFGLAILSIAICVVLLGLLNTYFHRTLMFKDIFILIIFALTLDAYRLRFYRQKKLFLLLLTQFVSLCLPYWQHLKI